MGYPDTKETDLELYNIPNAQAGCFRLFDYATDYLSFFRILLLRERVELPLLL